MSKNNNNNDVAVSENAAPKKPNKFFAWCRRFFGRIGNYLHDCWRERKKIVWYPKKQTAIATLLVTLALVVFATVVCALDLGVNQLIQAANKIY